jgi:hypothetical protein
MYVARRLFPEQLLSSVTQIMGLPSGALTGLAMGGLAGLKGNDLWNSTWKGGLIGMGTGIVMGGIMGGITAKLDGRRFWDGAKVREVGSSQPIPVSRQLPGECQLESMVATSDSYCDNFTRTQLEGTRVYGYTEDGYRFTQADLTWNEYELLTGHKVVPDQYLSQTEFANTFMDGTRISINRLQDNYVGHTVTVADLSLTEITRVNGTVVYKINSVNVMNPAIGTNGEYQLLKWWQIRSSPMFFIRY